MRGQRQRSGLASMVVGRGALPVPGGWGQEGIRLRRALGAIAATVALVLAASPAGAQFVQQGPKLVGSGAVGGAIQGSSVALSGDGNTAFVGGSTDNAGAGAVWVFTRSGGVWSQQGAKLVGSGALGPAEQGSVAVSGDGNTAIVGGFNDNGSQGAAWVFTRSGGAWTQQAKLVGAGAALAASEGISVALSADGNTAIVGGSTDAVSVGAAWVFTRSGGVWSQQGAKLVGAGAVGNAAQGRSVALSGDGNTAVVGGLGDNVGQGAAWVFTRSGGVWSQQGAKLVGTGAAGPAQQGRSVALSADGNTIVLGGRNDNVGLGAAWVFTRSGGVWTQQGSKLVGTGAVGSSQQGWSVALSGDGNIAVLGGYLDNNGAGAAWVFTRSGGVWTQQGSKLVGAAMAGTANQGYSVALSADGSTAAVGGPHDNSGYPGATWVYAVPSNQPPNCAAATAEPSVLWAPNHQLVPIEIVGVTDPDGDPVTIEVTGVTQDEPVNEVGDGNTCPDAVIENGQASVRAERSGQGNERVYAISFTATDDAGASCSGVVHVCVPHDQGDGPPPGLEARELLSECQDDGQFYNSLGPCPAGAPKPPPSGSAVTSLEGGTAVAGGNSARVVFTLAAAGDVDLGVYDLMGRRVMVLDRSYRAAGTHALTWNASRLTAGMYFYRLRTGATNVSKPLLILK